MESVLIAASVFVLLATLVFPQLLGLLLYFRLSRFPKWLAHAAGILAPPALFFYLFPLVFLAGFQEAKMRGEVCGTPGLGVAVLLLLGTAGQVCVSLLVQLYMFRRRSG